MSNDQRSARWPKKILKDLINGRLDSETIREMQTQPKDEDRFEKMLEVEQERVPWEEKILLPLQEHLYVVQKEDGSRIIKGSCGYEFGVYTENWKLNALVNERSANDGEIHRGPRQADPEWCVLREFYCPGCGVQLEVEAVPHGYPMIMNVLPDLDGFYAKHPQILERIMKGD